MDEMRTMRVYGGIIHLISVADKTLAVEWKMGIGFKTINLEVRDRIIVSKIKTRKSRLENQDSKIKTRDYKETNHPAVSHA